MSNVSQKYDENIFDLLECASVDFHKLVYDQNPTDFIPQLGSMEH